ncbi:hypothetical protein V6V47_02530 [Micromonospora sp. CPCC 205539]|uniref:hypothetical protein n=1 Tax=Micromonospora sp. CPCC 205539 TaxID=3122408 RepID=UPI002FF3F9E5
MRVRGTVTRGRGVRAGSVVTALLGGVVTLAPGAALAGAPGAGAPVCQVRDERLTEISGMVATDDGYVLVNDGADDESRRRIFFLDRRCAVVRTVAYPSRPRDTEDLAVAPDGTIWVADTGDNDRTRETVAVWRLAPGADRPVLHRLAYPDRAHDAEGMLLDATGRPVIVTKGGSGTAILYAPTTALRPGATTPLAMLGQVKLPDSTTSNPYSFLGRGVVTGAATAPDGRRVVLRSYADAFEYDVPDGDVVAALTTGTPRITPLPDEPQGESITYSRDGRSLLTISETADQPAGTRPAILRYPATTATATTSRPAEPTTPVPSTSTATRPAPADASDARDRMWPVAAAGGGTLLALVGLAGVLAWRRSARR